MTAKNTPLDTLKATHHVVIELADILREAVQESSAGTEYLTELIDSIRMELTNAVAEHVPGVRWDGPSCDIVYSDRDAADALRTYDDGSPVSLLVKLDEHGHHLADYMPRRHGDLDEFKRLFGPRLQLVGGTR